MVGRTLGRAGIVLSIVVACSGRSTTTSRHGDGTGGTGGSGGTTGGSATAAVGGTIPGGGGTGGTGGSGLAGRAGKGGAASGGTAGTSACGMPMLDCRNCEGGFTLPSCANGIWTCPDIDCPPPGTGGTAGAAGASGEGGESGAGDAPGTIEGACQDLCERVNPTCRDDPWYLRCEADCVAGSIGVPSGCTDEQIGYLVCMGNPGLCTNDSETPGPCADAEWELVRCLLGTTLAPGCDSRTTMQSVSTCSVVTICGGIESSVTCDGEDDGSGTSLCDCYRDGSFVATETTQATGILACAEAAEICADL